MKQFLSMAALLLCAAVAYGQAPSVSAAVNAASYIGTGLPNSGVAQGSMFILFGSNMGPAQLAQASSYPLPTTLSNTSVQVTVNGTTVNAIMVYTSATQVAAILPSNTPTGTGTVKVTYNGQTSATAPITVVSSAFGAFTLNQAGSGPAVLTFSDYSVLTLTHAAKPGDTVILWGTGLGAVQGNEAGGPLPGNLNLPVTVYVGGIQANVTYAGRSGCCAAEDQIVFVVPPGITGCYVPIDVQVGSVVSNFASMSIAQSGGACSDPNGFTTGQLASANQNGTLRVGTISLARIAFALNVLGVSLTSASETASATFARYPLSQLISASAQPSTLTAGACTVYTFNGSTPALPVDPVLPKYLDAGASLSLSGPNGTKTMAKDATGVYGATLSSGGLGGSSTPYLTAGTYTVTAPGGSGPDAVGAFTTSLTIPAALTWTNQSSITSVVRSQGQQVTWSGGDPNGYTLIFGSSSSGKASGAFYCVAKASAGQFTVPPHVLLALPASSAADSTTPTGFFAVGAAGNPTMFTAPGLDVGEFDYLNLSGKTLSFQ